MLKAVAAGLLETDVDVHDLQLEVVYYLFAEPRHHSIFLLLLGHLFEGGLQHLSYFFEYFLLLAPDSR